MYGYGMLHKRLCKFLQATLAGFISSEWLQWIHNIFHSEVKMLHEMWLPSRVYGLLTTQLVMYFIHCDVLFAALWAAIVHTNGYSLASN